jgi:hypothetical protein
LRTPARTRPFLLSLSFLLLAGLTACGEEPIDIVTTEPPEPQVAPGPESFEAALDAYFDHLEVTGALWSGAEAVRRESLDFIDRHYAGDPAARAAARETFRRAESSFGPGSEGVAPLASAVQLHRDVQRRAFEVLAARTTALRREDDDGLIPCLLGVIGDGLRTGLMGAGVGAGIGLAGGPVSSAAGAGVGGAVGLVAGAMSGAADHC